MENITRSVNRILKSEILKRKQCREELLRLTQL